jgi:drug/metabolite transporter (DMT)-like permease
MPARDKTAVSSRELALLVLLGLLWGMPYALTKLALATIPPITMVAARVSLAAATLWLFVYLSRKTIPDLRSLVWALFIQGTIACFIPYTFIAFGQQTVDSGLAAILNSTTPFFVCLVSVAWFGQERLSVERALGVTLGLSGVVMIAGGSALFGLGNAMAGQLAIVVAAFSSALSAIYGRRFASIAPEVAAAGTLTSAALVLVPLCFLLEAPLSVVPSAASLAALIVNGIVATAVGFVIYFRLIQTLGSMGVASVGYLKPGFGALIGFTLMGEAMTWTMAAGLVAILLGVAMMNKHIRATGPDAILIGAAKAMLTTGKRT